MSKSASTENDRRAKSAAPETPAKSTTRPAVKKPVKAGPIKAGPVKAGPVKAGPIKAITSTKSGVGKDSATARGPASILRKKEFSERVMARSGLSKAATRDAMTATLGVLADSIASGEALAIAGFGRTRVSRHITRSGADTYVVRFRPASGKGGAKGVEEDDDDV